MRAMPAHLTARVAATLDRARQWLRHHVDSVAARLRRSRTGHDVPAAPRLLLLGPVVADPVPMEPTERDVAMDFLASMGYRGNWNTRTMRAFRDITEGVYARAVEEIRGGPDALLTREAVALGIDPEDLFTHRVTDREAMRYASEDLHRWWAENGRMTVAEYRADLESSGAGERAGSLVG